MPSMGTLNRRRRGRAVLGHFFCIGVLLVAGVGEWSFAAGAGAASAVFHWRPERPRQGDVVHLWVEVPPGVSIEKGTIRSRSLHFFARPDQPGRFDAVFGVDAGQKPGALEIALWLRRPAEPEREVKRVSMGVLRRDFPEERLTLPDAMVHLSAEALTRVRKERKLISALWSSDTPERYWRGPFLQPVEGKPGSPFGARRWINGEPRSAHSGMDIKAPAGTPVKASNRGRVVLVGDFFFGGRSVFLDHGQGLYTMYMHLSKIDVAEGEIVEKGAVLGLVGSTGRATGPHLHWGVRLGGARVDPLSLLRRTRDFE